MVTEFSDDLQYCETAACARAAFGNGKLGSFLGIEVNLNRSGDTTEHAMINQSPVGRPSNREFSSGSPSGIRPRRPLHNRNA